MTKRFFLVIFVLLLSLNSIFAEDIAYVVKNSASPNSVITSIFSSQGLTYKTVYDSQVPLTNFSKYRIVLIEEDVTNRDLIPYDYANTLFFHRRVADSAWNIGTRYGETTADFQIKAKDIQSEILKNVNKDSENKILTYNNRQKRTQYLTTKPTYVTNVASTADGVTGIVIAAEINSLTKVRTTFFGLPDAQDWTEDAKLMFKNALKFEFSGQDMDGDGYFSGDDCNDNDANKWNYLKGYVDDDRDNFGTGALIDVCSGNYLPMGYTDNNLDCNDNNFNVNPEKTELPYNGIDDDCNGYDLADFDNDGYCKEGYTIMNKNLQCSLETGSIGTDCRDNDNTYNPGSSNIDKNCRNEPPVFSSRIEDITFDEDKNQINILNLNNYFSDIDSSLIFNVSGNTNINITIVNGLVSFYPAKDWFGVEKVTFSASDGKSSVNSNEISIEVVDANEPPEFSAINCTDNILEDTEYGCEITATDFENNTFSFSIANENKLHCSFQNNTLKYKPYQDYFGVASCLIRASDAYGYNDYLFRVNIQNVNDAPIIADYYPQTNPRILNNTNQVFNITIRNIDNDDINISWFLNNQNIGSGNNYTLNANRGNYNLTAIASDGQLTASHSWDVFVGFAEELTCGEAKGFLCSSNEVCNSNLLAVLDSKSCCNVACSEKPPSFKDIAKKCQNKSNNLEIIFKDITSMDKFQIGEISRKKIQIENNANISQEVVLEIYIYDLTKDKIIERQRYSFQMDRKTNKIQEFEIKFPWNINEKNKFALFVNVKGNGDIDYCNSNYIRIVPERMFYSIMIEEKSIDKTEISCGDSFDLYTKIRNIGTEEQNLVLEIDNSFLKIDEEIDEINIEGYGEEDSWEDTFTFTIPDNAKAGNYTIKINVLSNNNTRTYEDLKISLGECMKEFSSSSNIGLIKLTNTNNFQIFEDPKNKKLLLWNSIIVFIVLSFLLITVVYRGVQRKRTKKQLQKEITKIIKRKNGKPKRHLKHKRKRGKKWMIV